MNPNDELQEMDIEESSQSYMGPLPEASADLLKLAQEAKENNNADPSGEDKNAFVTAWLNENYELDVDYNTPRHEVYDNYRLFCESHGIPPINSASFGKYVRNVYPKMKTRRLGNRGQSKYHYCGIKRKIQQTEQANISLLSSFTSNISRPSLNNLPVTLGSIAAGVGAGVNHNNNDGEGTQTNAPEMESLILSTAPRPVVLPNFPEVSSDNLPSDIPVEVVQRIMTSYRTLCTAMLNSIQHLKFSEVDSLMRLFWGQLSADQRRVIGDNAVVELMCSADVILYETVITMLLPNALQALPLPVVQAIRQFSRQIEFYVMHALDGYPPNLLRRRIDLVRQFSQQLRRYTSLNQMAQCAAQIMTTRDQVQTMIDDWTKIDFDNIKDQAMWVCGCKKNELVQILELDFKQLLHSSTKLDHWTTWLDSLVNRLIFGAEKPPTDRIQIAQNFILKWNFIGGLCMRDLTMRSSTTFGSFHLLKTFFDEYIFYTVEQRLSHHRNISGESDSLSDSMPNEQQFPNPLMNIGMMPGMMLPGMMPGMMHGMMLQGMMAGVGVPQGPQEERGSQDEDPERHSHKDGEWEEIDDDDIDELGGS